MHAVQGGILGCHKSAPVRDKHMLSPSFQLPTNKWRSAGPGSSWCLLSITGFYATKLTDNWMWNWEIEHYNYVLDITRPLSFISGIQKSELDIYIWFSSALHFQCTPPGCWETRRVPKTRARSRQEYLVRNNTNGVIGITRSFFPRWLLHWLTEAAMVMSVTKPRYLVCPQGFRVQKCSFSFKGNDQWEKRLVETWKWLHSIGLPVSCSRWDLKKKICTGPVLCEA